MKAFLCVCFLCVLAALFGSALGELTAYMILNCPNHKLLLYSVEVAVLVFCGAGIYFAHRMDSK